MNQEKMNYIIIQYLKISSVKILIVFILFVYMASVELVAQTAADIEQFTHLFNTNKKNTNYKVYFENNSNEIKQISSVLFLFYKEFFSSQDGNHCVFYPSCSVYTISAIKNQGLAVGIINGIDRLSRCNRLSPENYKMYKNTKLFYDPLD